MNGGVLVSQQENKDNESGCGKKYTVKDIVKIIISVTIALVSIIFTVLICFSIYRTGFTVDSILSTLLAFFSIFISIFFYFKADETSSKFYDSSYEFMKDQSVLLGRIEERFGEKFENLFSRIDHLDSGQAEKETELHGKTNEISNIIENLIKTLDAHEKSGQTEELLEELRKYHSELTEKSLEYNLLVENLQEMRQEAQETSHYIKAIQTLLPNSFSDQMLSFFANLDERDMDYLLRCGGRIQSSHKTYRLARSYGLCDEKGRISSELQKALDSVRFNHQRYY